MMGADLWDRIKYCSYLIFIYGDCELFQGELVKAFYKLLAQPVQIYLLSRLFTKKKELICSNRVDTAQSADLRTAQSPTDTYILQ